MSSRLPRPKAVLIVLVPLLLMLALGIWLGGHSQYLPKPVANTLVGPEDRRITLEALDTIHDKYFRPVSQATLSNDAIAGAVADLHDRFSSYLAPKPYGRFQLTINNEFSGVGTAVRAAKTGLQIVTVYPKSPAKQAGLRVGDIVTRSNGHKLAGLTEDAATALIKGREGSIVTLTLQRGKRTFTRRLTRARISVPVVSSRIANAGGKRVAYIALSTFGPDTAHVEVADAIRRLKRRGAKGIVFDLRGNGGGLVKEAQLIASMFIAKGPIVTTRGRSVPSETLNAIGHPIAGNMPTVVLVDGGTASASEIVSGALQDTKRAKLIGVRTFGKGVFQEIMPLKNGGALDLTVGQYFLPSGRNLGGPGTKPGQGLKPDVEVRDNPHTKRDEVLAKALHVLAAEL
ncbi:MAG TPA: S41 family peptidase [Solirubrobacteraceae bacterium]|nr:S41 family peptidase [Solirubrobacteraceae bacterium]